MKSTLERLKLIDNLTTEIPISKKDFVEKLKMNVDEGGTGLFLSAFEAFSSSRNHYKGHVTFDSFKIRRRRKLFDMGMNLAVAEGSFRQREDLLVIESTINGFRSIFIPIMFFALVVYGTIVFSLIFTDMAGGMRWVVLPFIFLHALFMMGIPYFLMRRSVSRMKYDLERDFFYMTK